MNRAEQSRWWSWAGLLAAALVYAAAVMTLGAGFLLAPIGFAVSVWALMRVRGARRFAAWTGVAANALLLLAALYVFAAIVFGRP